MRRPAWPAIVVLCLFGCGYFQAGTWEDDPKNFRRAFGAAPPYHLEILHSQYTRFPHFTMEQEYFFAFRDNRKTHQAFFGGKSLQELSAAEVEEWMMDMSERPEWFAPLGADAYRGWRSSERSVGDFRLFLGEAEGILYLHDRQL